MHTTLLRTHTYRATLLRTHTYITLLRTHTYITQTEMFSSFSQTFKVMQSHVRQAMIASPITTQTFAHLSIRKGRRRSSHCSQVPADQREEDDYKYICTSTTYKQQIRLSPYMPTYCTRELFDYPYHPRMPAR